MHINEMLEKLGWLCVWLLANILQICCIIAFLGFFYVLATVDDGLVNFIGIAGIIVTVLYVIGRFADVKNGNR